MSSIVSVSRSVYLKKAKRSAKQTEVQSHWNAEVRDFTPSEFRAARANRPLQRQSTEIEAIAEQLESIEIRRTSVTRKFYLEYRSSPGLRHLSDSVSQIELKSRPRDVRGPQGHLSLFAASISQTPTP